MTSYELRVTNYEFGKEDLTQRRQDAKKEKQFLTILGY
jgi:hypothetical protein